MKWQNWIIINVLLLLSSLLDRIVIIIINVNIIIIILIIREDRFSLCEEEVLVFDIILWLWGHHQFGEEDFQRFA